VSDHAAIPAEPRECTLDHPAATQNFEAAMPVSAFHDFELNRKLEKRAREFRPGIAAVSEDRFQPRIFP
jgi:hypothetical protein